MDFKITQKDRIFSEFFRVDRVKLVQDCYHSEPIEVTRYHLERPEVVAVLLENTDQNTLVMVQQFRYSSTNHNTTNGWTLEIVGGLIDPGETPEDAAIRESLEETGYQVNQLIPWSGFHPSLGVSNEFIHLYYAQVTDQDKIETGGGLAHENEDLQVLELPLSDLMEQIESGTLTDSKSIVALLRLALKKQTGA